MEEDLDFANQCTAEFVADVCKYWLGEYQIDGIRFDYVKGFHRPDLPEGLTGAAVPTSLGPAAVPRGPARTIGLTRA